MRWRVVDRCIGRVASTDLYLYVYTYLCMYVCMLRCLSVYTDEEAYAFRKEYAISL